MKKTSLIAYGLGMLLLGAALGGGMAQAYSMTAAVQNGEQVIVVQMPTDKLLTIQVVDAKIKVMQQTTDSLASIRLE